MEQNQKKVIFSGIQPSGILTLGNYLGAIKNWVTLQDQYHCYYCVVDMHAITVRQDPAELRRRTLDVAAIYMAAGIDPQKSIIYVQSHVPQHAELCWILNCYTYLGELSRMTQYKDKAAKHQDNLNSGLFTYPVLMAADILLYQADLVPVGSDQKQHVELTRDIALRFNNLYGDVFTVPEPFIGQAGARIMSLQEPTSKMSKSDPNPNGYISIIDDPDTIRRKIKRAVTDSDGQIRLDAQEKPGVTNLLGIYAACSGISPEQAEAEFAGRNYGALKEGVSEAVIAQLAPLQARFKEIRGDKGYLEGVLRENAQIAQQAAVRTLRKVHKKVGFTAR
jgi:tryptophanyl-tRNA synthetase